MSSEERNTWAYAAVALVVGIGYLAYLLVRLRDADVAELVWQRPLLIALGVSLVANMFATPARTRGQRDQRDRDIDRFGQYVGFFVLAFGFLPAFVLALLEADPFWIGNAMYAAYVLNALAASATKLVAYRRGLPAW